MVTAAHSGAESRATRLFKNLGKRWQHEVGLVVAIVLLGAYFSSRNSVFLSLENIGNIAEQITYLGILAVGMTFVIVSGQFDLSVGSIYGLSAILFGLALEAHWNVWLAALAAVLAGGGMGLTNGMLTTTLRVPVIIITLGTLSVYRGIAYWLSGTFPVADFDQSSALFKFGQRKLIPWPSGLDWIPDLVLALVVVAFLGHLVLKQMTFGQHVYAIGSNRTAAALSGVRVSRVQIGVLVVLGLTAGFSGVLGVAQSGSADPNAGAGFELDVIAAVIIGGAAISGGRGTILASLLGILLIGEVRNGLVIIGASIYGQIIVSGALVIIAVAIDRLITGRGERQSSIRKEVKLKTRQLGQRVGAVRRAGTR